jgi:hypothetical protein
MATNPYDANQADFLGEGTAAPAQAPALSAQQIDEARLRKAEWLRNQGLDANGNQLPAYGTPVSQGGTASGFQVSTPHNFGVHVLADGTVLPGGSAMQEVTSTPLGANNVPLVGATGTQSVYQNFGEGVTGNGAETIPNGGPVQRSSTPFTVAPDASAGGGNGMLNAQTSQGTGQLQADLTRRQQASTDQFGATVNGLNGSPLTNANATNQAANQAEGALGPAPTIDQGLADRGLGDVKDSIGMQRTVYDQLLNGPNTAQRLGSQVLRNQLALARSAAGGPGAVQEALRNAQNAAPELQAAAAQAATAETLQRTQAAGSVAQGVGTTALQGRGQDVQVAAQNQQAASALIQNVSQLTGQQLELDQRNQELLGQMARDLASQNFNWGQLSSQQQEAEFDRWVKTYGIDANIAAQIKVASIASKKGVMDYAIPIIGSLAQLGAAAVA